MILLLVLLVVINFIFLNFYLDSKGYKENKKIDVYNEYQLLILDRRYKKRKKNE